MLPAAARAVRGQGGNEMLAARRRNRHCCRPPSQRLEQDIRQRKASALAMPRGTAMAFVHRGVAQGASNDSPGQHSHALHGPDEDGLREFCQSGASLIAELARARKQSRDEAASRDLHSWLFKQASALSSRSPPSPVPPTASSPVAPLPPLPPSRRLGCILQWQFTSDPSERQTFLVMRRQLLYPVPSTLLSYLLLSTLCTLCPLPSALSIPSPSTLRPRTFTMPLAVDSSRLAELFQPVPQQTEVKISQGAGLILPSALAT